MNQFIEYATQSFTLPDICLRLRNVLDDPRSDMDDIAALISIDPSLTAKLLRLANSALFRFPSQIESITKAVSVIGGEALYNLVLAETANIAFKHFDKLSMCKCSLISWSTIKSNANTISTISVLHYHF